MSFPLWFEFVTSIKLKGQPTELSRRVIREQVPPRDVLQKLVSKVISCCWRTCRPPPGGSAERRKVHQCSPHNHLLPGGKHLLEYELSGQDRAAYGSELIKRLSADSGKPLRAAASPSAISSKMRLFYITVVEFADAVCGIGSGRSREIPRTESAK
jgi:hypothetical protein